MERTAPSSAEGAAKSSNARTPHARPGSRNRDADSAPLPSPPAPDGPRWRSAGDVSQFLGVRSPAFTSGAPPERGSTTCRVGKHLSYDPDVVRRWSASLPNVALLCCGQPVGQRGCGRERSADRRGSSSTHTLDRAISLEVGAGDVGVEPCVGVPPKRLAGPHMLRPSPATLVAPHCRARTFGLLIARLAIFDWTEPF